MMKKESVEKIGSLEVPKHVIYRKLREFTNLLTFCAFAPYMPLCLTRLQAFVLYATFRLTHLIYVHYLHALRALFLHLIYALSNVIKSPIKGSFRMFYEGI